METVFLNASLLCTPVLVFLLPLGVSSARNAHSLCYNITVNPKARPRQQRCDVQGHVDDRMILHCDCSFTQISFFDPLGRKVDAIDNWAEQTEMLRDVVDTLNQLISDNVFPMGADPPSLQGRMCCWHGASGGRHGSWQFSFGGQIGLLFDPNTRKWTEVHPGASWNKTTWENDRQLTEFLRKVSIGDCPRWLGKFLLPWKGVDAGACGVGMWVLSCAMCVPG
uniref:MHC class I-like antigen recognition-like domain-containing protein n=1 Tax=Oryctolagus cuniculus TaxID=9986 RepID=G1SI00_RABIT